MKPEERREHQQKVVNNIEAAERVAEMVLDAGKKGGLPSSLSLECAQVLATCAVARAVLSMPV